MSSLGRRRHRPKEPSARSTYIRNILGRLAGLGSEDRTSATLNTSSTFRKAAKANTEARKAAKVNAEAEVSQVEWFCVRTCDGYYFPQIKSGGTTKQQSCEHACPSAPMAVYEGSTIEAASSLTGEKYTSLPAAFSFRSNTTQNCSCSPQGRARSFSMRTLSEDPTLRTGDIVFGDRGAFVYQHSKLAPLERSFLLSPKTREKIRSLLVAGRTRPQADVNELQSSEAEEAGSIRPIASEEKDFALGPMSIRAAETTQTVDRALEEKSPLFIIRSLIFVIGVSITIGLVIRKSDPATVVKRLARLVKLKVTTSC